MSTNAKAFLWVASTPNGTYNAWSDAPLPAWRDELGAGPGEIRAKLPRTWTAMGIPGDALGTDDLVLTTTGATTVKIYKLDQAAAAGAGGTLVGGLLVGSSTVGDPPFPCTFVYQGTLEELTPSLSGTQDDVEFVLIPPHSILTSHFDDVITFVDADPVDIARHFFEAGYLPTLTWDPRNPQSSGRQVTQTFQYQTYKSILDFCVQAAGSGWYSHVDARGQFRLWQPDPTVATHVVQIGRELAEAQYTLTRTLWKNQVILRGKGTTSYQVSTGNLTGATVSGSSVVGGTVSGQTVTVTTPAIVSNAKSPDWTRANARSVIYNDPDIDDQVTADIIAAALLQRVNIISVRARLRLVSNAGALTAVAVLYDNGMTSYPSGQLSPTSARGYLLESVQPGDTLQLWLDEPDDGAFIVGKAAIGTARVNGSQVGLVQTPQIIAGLNYNGGDTLDVELSTPQPHIVAAHQRLQALAEKALGASVLGP